MAGLLVSAIFYAVMAFEVPETAIYSDVTNSVTDVTGGFLNFFPSFDILKLTEGFIVSEIHFVVYNKMYKSKGLRKK